MTTDTAAPAGSAGPGGLRSLGRWIDRGRSGGILIPFVILFVVISVASPAFLRLTNLLNIPDQQSAILIMAAAGTLVLISGGIDLSVGATYSLAGVVAGEIAQSHSVLLSVVLALLTGLVVGLVNGFITTVGRINPLIATLAMSFIVDGLASRVTGGNLVVLTSNVGFAKIAQTEWLGVRTSIWIAVAAILILGVILSRTTLGRYLYAAGGNAEAAKLAGVRVTSVRIAAFAASGVAAALAGVIDTSRTVTAVAGSGDSFTFVVLAGIVVGGTSILGGEGAIWRTIIGVLFIALIYNGFTLLGADPLYRQITLGVILLLAVGMDALSRNWRS